MQNKDISKIMNMERSNVSPAVYSLLQQSDPATASAERFFHAAKTASQEQKFKGRKCKTVDDFTF